MNWRDKKLKSGILLRQRSCKDANIRLLVLVHGAVSRGDDVSVGDQGSPTPEFPPAPAMEVDGGHPRNLKWSF